MYVRWQGPWWHGLWLWIPMQVLIGYCVFRLVTTPGASLVDAFVMFALATALMRAVVAVFMLDQTISKGAWAALGLLLAANLARAYWK
jgi:hypothetical protein